jgi:dipeptidyl aminopeptidase/acylaminoacyl peptidase
MRRAGALLGVLLSTNAVAAPPTLQELLKPDQNTLVNISPGGDYIAVGTRIDEKVMVAIMERKTRKVVRGLDPERNGAVERLDWVGKDRIFVMSSRTSNGVEQAYLDPAIIAVNVDGSRRSTFYSSVIDTIRNDDDHILVSVCGKSNSKGCWFYVQKVDTKGGFAGPRIADAPMINAEFMADNDGNVRFAYGWNDDDVQQTWLLADGKWTLLNDEAVSGIEVTPVGVSRDGASGFLQSERRDGPDVIERIAFASGNREVVMSDPRLDPAFIVWSADGAQPIGAAYGLQVPRARFWDEKDPDAKLLRQLEAAFPDDAVVFGSGSEDGQNVILRVWSDRDPGSTFLLDRPAKNSTLIFRRKPWLDPARLARSQSIEFKARDGLGITGYLTMPTQAGNGPPPLVVLPHGGPFGISDAWGYDEEVQILATHGYAVLRVNFRGSGGFGRKFVEAGYRQWGKKMQDDVTDATRWLVGQGKVDASRICIWGSSYGGYAAMMGAIEAPDLYKCVIATAAVSDLNLMWKWGDIHRSRSGRSYLRQAVGEDRAELLAYSPVRRAGEIKADLMLAHGVRDQRVSYEHAKAMQEALDKAGKHYEGYFPRNETHGIYGDENRVEYYTRVLQFLDKRIGSTDGG